MKERVATHNRKVAKVAEVHNNRACSLSNKRLEKLEAKAAAAEERREQMQKQSLYRVANHNRKVMEIK